MNDAEKIEMLRETVRLHCILSCAEHKTAAQVALAATATAPDPEKEWWDFDPRPDLVLARIWGENTVRFFSAAPLMAKALLEFLTGHQEVAEQMNQASAALTAAGVLP